MLFECARQLGLVLVFLGLSEFPLKATRPTEVLLEYTPRVGSAEEVCHLAPITLKDVIPMFLPTQRVVTNDIPQRPLATAPSPVLKGDLGYELRIWRLKQKESRRDPGPVFIRNINVVSRQSSRFM